MVKTLLMQSETYFCMSPISKHTYRESYQSSNQTYVMVIQLRCLIYKIHNAVHVTVINMA